MKSNIECGGCKRYTLSAHLDPQDVVCESCGDKQAKVWEDLWVRMGKRYPKVKVYHL